MSKPSQLKFTTSSNTGEKQSAGKHPRTLQYGDHPTKPSSIIIIIKVLFLPVNCDFNRTKTEINKLQRTLPQNKENVPILRVFSLLGLTGEEFNGLVDLETSRASTVIGSFLVMPKTERGKN